MASLRSACRKIVAVGRNYADHAKELGNQIPTEPVIFLKPSSSLIEEGEAIRMPPGVSELHHEVELGVVIGQELSLASEEAARSSIKGIVLALDMTDRRKQNELKKAGLPWSLAKGFDTSCPISKLVALEEVPDMASITLWCKVNGEERQRGNTKDFLFPTATLLSFISQYFTLQPDDIVLTGTPAGVGPVKSGDVIESGIDGHLTMKFHVA